MWEPPRRISNAGLPGRLREGSLPACTLRTSDQAARTCVIPAKSRIQGHWLKRKRGAFREVVDPGLRRGDDWWAGEALSTSRSLATSLYPSRVIPAKAGIHEVATAAQPRFTPDVMGSSPRQGDETDMEARAPQPSRAYRPKRRQKKTRQLPAGSESFGRGCLKGRFCMHCTQELCNCEMI